MHMYRAAVIALLIVAGCQGGTRGTVGYESTEKSHFLSRPGAPHVRVLCYNVNWDAIFPDNDPQNHKWREHDRRAEFARVVCAVNPDIVCLQEINPQRSADDLALLFDHVLPIGGTRWKAHMGADNVILSRYPIDMTSTDTVPPTGRGHAAARIDLPDASYKHDLYLINAHFKAAGGEDNIARRQQHADAIVAWLRDARTEGGEIDLPAGTPIVVLGDLNVYETDPHMHLATLVTGDIKDESTYGKDSRPDWDDTAMTDLLPCHNGRGDVTWTWRDDSQEFRPGDLDHVIYSDSTMTVLQSGIINTMTMSDDELQATGMMRNDVVLDPTTGNFDHLPIVFDFYTD